MIGYSGKPEQDQLLADWWMRMDADGDLPRTFAAGSRTMRELFHMMAPPQVLFYERDAEGIWFACWVEQLLSAACVGVWCRTDRRRSKGLLFSFLEALDLILRFAPVVIGITRHENLLASHTRLGYTVLGAVPNLFEGTTAGWVMVLTRDRLQEAIAKYWPARKYGEALADAPRKRARV